MKVLLIILCAIRIAGLFQGGLKLYQENGKFEGIAASILMSALWLASLVWLIKL